MTAVTARASTTIEVAGREVRLSNPDKVFFPAIGVTKRDLCDYYLTVADAALAHLRDRPTVLKRWVDGVEGEPFFQKRVPENAPRLARDGYRDASRAAARARELAPADAAHLVWAVNLGVIDFNPWPVRRPRPGPPRRAAGRPRPGPGVPCLGRAHRGHRWATCCATPAWSGGRRPPARGASTSTCGSNPRWGFGEVRRAALALAREVERRDPAIATSKWWKEERHGVFIDYNQNARTARSPPRTPCAPMPDARVSTPLTWDEVADVEPAGLRIDTVPGRLASFGDLSAGMDDAAGELDGLLALAAADEERGLGDAPWPPHFAKGEREPRRAPPSRRAKDRG